MDLRRPVVRTYGIVMGAVCTLLLSTSIAEAAEYEVTSLGDAPLSYIEHRFDINNSGRIAYTRMVGGDEHAMYSDRGVTYIDLHQTAGAFGSNKSRAEAINDANHVVGYRRTGPSIFREAMLWFYNGSTYDARAALHTSAPNGPEISAAYDISNGTSGGGASYVVGYGRADFQTPSDAILWTLDASGSVTSAVNIPTSAGMDYNIAYGVNDDGIVVGGEGIFGGSYGAGAPGTAMYAFAYDSVSDTLIPIPGVQASDGYRTSVAASVSENYVTGYALDDATGNVTAFVHELGTSNTETGILVGPDGGSVGPRSLGYGVRESAGEPIVYGLSEVSGATNSMGGLVYERRGANVQECDVNYSGDWSGRVTHIYTMNDNGEGVGLRSDGGIEAVFIEDVSVRDVSLDLYMRDLEDAGETDYYWGTFSDPINASSGSASLMFSNARGCGQAFSCDGSTDLSDEGQAGTDYFVTGSGTFTNGDANTPQFTEDPTAFSSVQAYTNAGGGCSLSPVESPSLPNANINPPGEDPWGNTWADCTAHINAETNVDTSLENCGGCGISTDDGRVCTIDTCDDGTIANNYDTNSSYCFISNNCVPQAASATDPSATNPSNECEACYTSQNRFGYSDDPDGTTCSDDGLTCTVDQCVNGNCDHSELVANSCLISGDCYTEDQENPGNDCEACQSNTSETSFTDDPDGTSCSELDGYACTTPECEDGNCNQRAAFTGCQIGSDCYSFNQERPGNECQACRSSNPESWTNDANGTGCDDDNCYTAQSCSNGSCGGGNPVVDGREQDDTWQQRTDLPSQTEDNDYRAGDRLTLTDGTIFPENDDDWFAGYFDDYACDRGRYPACGTEEYNCTCIPFTNICWGCDTRYRVCNINCGFGGGASKNHETQGGTNGNPQGRIALTSPAGSDFDMCVYLQCAVGGESPSSVNWFIGGNSNYTNSTMSIDGRNLDGRCYNKSGVTDIEFHPNCPSQNDTTRAWVRVFDNTNNARCNAPYRLDWGNDLD